MGVGQGGGRRLGSDVRRLHRRVRPLRGSWGSRQFFFAERAYPEPPPTPAPATPAAPRPSATTPAAPSSSGCTSPGGCRLSSSGAAHGGSGGRSGEQKKGGGGGGGYSGGGKRGGKCRGQQAGYPNQQQAGGAPWQVMGQQRPGGPMICFQWPTQFPGQGPYGAGSWRPGGQGLLGASPQAQTAFAPLQVSPAAQGWD